MQLRLGCSTWTTHQTSRSIQSLPCDIIAWKKICSSKQHQRQQTTRKTKTVPDNAFRFNGKAVG
eukprot:1146364-Amphidinium_carterae.1